MKKNIYIFIIFHLKIYILLYFFLMLLFLNKGLDLLKKSI